jgi:hypothetical integral membrane protein (TIGR02206 family)
MNSTLIAEAFVWCGRPHLLALLFLALVALGLVICGRRWRSSPAQTWLSRGFALAILLGQGAMQIETMLPRNWTLAYSLPLQLCDLAWMISAYALWTHRRWASGILYYWGLTLTIQGLITPHLDLDFPSFEFFMFFYGHGAVVIAAIYLTWGVGLHPDWNDYRGTFATTLGWGVSVCTFNSLFGTNYGYLNGKPPMPSALDFLGPYPVYLVCELSLATIIWGLMTWAWTREGKRQSAATRSPAQGRSGRFDVAREGRPAHTETA